MEKTKLVIVIRGGILESVFSNQDIEYILVDHDNLDLENDDFDMSVMEPDIVMPDGMAKIFDEESKNSALTSDKKRANRISNILSKLNF